MKRLLIAGFGDIARRALPALARRYQVTRLSRQHGIDLAAQQHLVQRLLRHRRDLDALGQFQLDFLDASGLIDARLPI